ncbi:Na+/H+ antiporter NhaA [Streptomyces montanisoli]|uniref:Na(+)/H(+) antiporter NhaA n=1 Tax=Streptomyces montanisoli TaxID=2798581 RepID=A0A940MJG8_9ACTN|nr:Na+/H+ antiporter NhaA [Streptomyces montanisoli]MBP0461225.1 Na+/H+ antiporter NhaA [Streptomyces montanisoli]
MTDSAGPARGDTYTGRTECRSSSHSPWRAFLRTETGSAAVLLAGVIAALVWANIGIDGYESVWRTTLSVRVGDAGVSLHLRDWVNSALMAMFFFVVGLEARREFDMGELRERRRVALPMLAGACGLCVPVLIYLAINAGHGTEHGWGAAMSTDTAFALGMLALLGRRLPAGLRTFVLSVAVVDDFVALAVIAFAYSGSVALSALLVAVGILAAVLVVRALKVRTGAVYAVAALAIWVALLKSGIDPVVTGLVMGLLTYAYPAARSDLERASGLFRRFREQPTPELERSARRGLASAISPNERLQRTFHPWTSYVIVPLFALANAGIEISPHELSRAFSSTVTWGVLAGLVLGKPLAILGTSLVTAAATGGRVRPPVGWGATAAGGTVAGVGFTVSLLIATLAFHGQRLTEAKIGILSAMAGAFLLTWTVTAVIGRLPKVLRGRALLGSAETIIDLAVPVDPDRDKVRGPHDAPVTVVEYGDFECPYCGRAEPAIRELLAEFGDDVRYVWRHLPLRDVHPRAQLAAEATEAAAEQGAFWEMHDLLFAHQGALGSADLYRYAEELSLDTERFGRHLRRRAGARRVAEDVESADLSGVSGTPTFFVNGRRHTGAYDIDHLSRAVSTARKRAALEATA